MICSRYDRSGLGGDLAVTSSPAAGVENSQPGEFIQSHSGFGLKGGSIFIVVSDLVAVPLKTEAGEVLLLDESRNALNNRMRCRARLTSDGLCGD